MAGAGALLACVGVDFLRVVVDLGVLSPSVLAPGWGRRRPEQSIVAAGSRSGSDARTLGRGARARIDEVLRHQQAADLRLGSLIEHETLGVRADAIDQAPLVRARIHGLPLRIAARQRT